ncbi:MAG TPA: folylpolyglutamate synthase/dihydrofolate synthase family protein [Pyrinomonadaceae bacterium]|nr:folylpolyglutamate synthase/dihydrofolate synthase family protein [Pyrinomonadaceae bacterium]
MNFAETEAYLLSLGNEVSAMKLGLDNIRILLAALGNPQNSYLKVQVAGTNGKGSVCAFLDSICRTAGVKVGLYTSPHLISITERVRINGVDINESDFARLATLIRSTAETLVESGTLEYTPTFFEQVTAIALLAFAEAKIEVAILETGLGGRLDATTAAKAEIAAITRIDLDHQKYLGDTIEEIAAEKSAIIHAGSRVVVGDQYFEALNVILARCDKLAIKPFADCFSDKLALDMRRGSVVAVFKTEREIYHDSDLGLLGWHQLENAKVAVMVAETLKYEFHLPIDREIVLEGLENARHKGRLEYQGGYLFDGAHNVGGAKALVAYLQEFETRPITLLFGAMDDKPVADMLELLVPRAAKIVLTQPSNERSLHYDELLEAMPGDRTNETTFVTDSVANGLDIAEAVTPDDGIILVTGSLYLIGDVKREVAKRS